MCRIYGFKATEPTKVECQLVHAQNALIEQSKENMFGVSHAHGWGIVTYHDGLPHVEKQAWAAYHGEHFQRVAARDYSDVVIAHVRRATIGGPSVDNTHPFVHGLFSFAHNGSLPNFERLRMITLDHMDPIHRTEIGGSTDSEHVFHLLLSEWMRNPGRPLVETLRATLRQIVAWSREIDPDAPVSLNTLWSDGEHLVGSRLGRTLWYLERDGVHLCEVCGRRHTHHHHRHAPGPYRSVDIASEPITGERWLEVPNDTVYSVEPDVRLHLWPLEAEPSKVSVGLSASPR